MHDGAAGVVFQAEFPEPAAAPDPVGDGGIDQRDPKRREPDHRRELHALGEATDDEGRCDDGEGQLKHGENGFRDGAAQGIPPYIGHKYLSESHEAVGTAAIAKCEAVGVDQPQYRNQTRDRKALHQYRQHVFGAHQARIKQRESGYSHKQHQCRRRKHPRRITRIQCRGLLCQSQVRHYPCQHQCDACTALIFGCFHLVFPIVGDMRFSIMHPDPSRRYEFGSLVPSQRQRSCRRQSFRFSRHRQWPR